MPRKTQKELWLVDTLSRHPRTSFEEIAARFEKHFDGRPLPKSSFRKLIQSLGRDMGVYVECDRRRGYTYRLERGGNPYLNHLHEVRANSLALAHILHDAMPEPRCIDMDCVPTTDSRLYTLCRALKQRKRVVMRYHSPSRGGYQLTFCPYGVKMHLCKWYVVGHSLLPAHADKPVRSFAVERIDELELTAVGYKLPEDFSVQRYYEGCVGVLTLEEPETVILRVTGFQRMNLRKLPLHESQQLVSSTEEYDLYRLFLRPNAELMTAIIGYGRNCEVVFPQSLRERVVKEARAMLELYNAAGDEGRTTNYGEHCTIIENQYLTK